MENQVRAKDRIIDSFRLEETLRSKFNHNLTQQQAVAGVVHVCW